LDAKQPMVEVYRAVGEMEDRVIQGLLDSRDIPSLLKSSAARSVHAFAVDGMGEVRVMVWESDAERARGLIESKDDV